MLFGKVKIFCILCLSGVVFLKHLLRFFHYEFCFYFSCYRDIFIASLNFAVSSMLPRVTHSRPDVSDFLASSAHTF
jgi:hypothetical protein